MSSDHKAHRYHLISAVHSHRRFMWLFASTAFLMMAVSLVPALSANVSVFAISNWVGPTTRSLIDNGTLESAPGMLGARMPLATLFVSLAYEMVGDRLRWVIALKALLTVALLCLLMRRVLRSLPSTGTLAWGCFAVLLVPLLSTATMANVVNVQVEEAYGFLPLAWCCAMLFSPAHETSEKPDNEGWLFGLGLCLLFLAKSAYLPVSLVLLVSFAWLRRGRMAWLVAAAMLGLTMLCWANYQWNTSGRFTLGTSVDGFNFYKGNNEKFLERYPPPPGTNLDSFDGELQGRWASRNEWEANDHFRNEALRYMARHPLSTLKAMALKFHCAMLSLTKYGSTASGGLRGVVEGVGLLLFRILFIAALAASVSDLWHRRATRGMSVCFLAIGAAVMLPYLLGFAYTRHASVLMLPHAFFVSSWLQAHAELVQRTTTSLRWRHT